MYNKDIEVKTYLERYQELSKDKDNRVEFIDGIIFNYSNTSIKHNEIVSVLAMKLRQYLKGSKCKSFTDGIELILEEGERGSYVKPDAFITCNTEYKGQSVVSIPLVVFEVISDGNPENDYDRKYKLYRKYGINEYNIIEQNGNIVQYTMQNDFYHITNTFKGKDIFTSSVFTDLKISLEELFEEY